MEKLYTSKTFLKMAGGRMHTPHPNPPHPPLANGHKLQKPSKESGMFQPLSTISFFFLLKGRVKRGGGHGKMPPKYAPGAQPPQNIAGQGAGFRPYRRPRFNSP